MNAIAERCGSTPAQKGCTAEFKSHTHTQKKKKKTTKNKTKKNWAEHHKISFCCTVALFRLPNQQQKTGLGDNS